MERYAVVLEEGQGLERVRVRWAQGYEQACRYALDWEAEHVHLVSRGAKATVMTAAHYYEDVLEGDWEKTK